MDARTDEGHLQRRSALRAAAAVGLAVPLAYAGQAGSAALASTAQPSTGQPSTGQPSTNQPDADQPAEPVIAHVRNARTGEIDIFRGSTQVRVHDVALAALLARAAR